MTATAPIQGAPVSYGDDQVVEMVGGLIGLPDVRRFVLLESKRFISIFQTTTIDHPVLYQMPALMRTAVAYFGIRTRLHFRTGLGGDFHRGLDSQTIFILRLELDVNRFQRQRMAKWYQF